MSKSLVPTHAGDDSDGRIWGIEGVNIVFILVALLLGIGLALMLSRQHSPALSAGVGALPVLLTAVYIGLLRQGKPKAFDTDLIDTLATGTGWMPPDRQQPHPLHRHAST